MIHANDDVVKEFRSIGWSWGGYWNNPKDYQHFSATAR
jgi:D-alanyl-D-alanine carboxypeptidase-like protein